MKRTIQWAVGLSCLATLITAQAPKTITWEFFDNPFAVDLQIAGVPLLSFQNVAVLASRPVRDPTVTFTSADLNGEIDWNIANGTHAVIRLAGDWKIKPLDPGFMVSGVTPTMVVVQTNGGGHQLTWPAEILWPGGVILPQCQTDGCQDSFSFVVHGGGTHLVLNGAALDLAFAPIP